MLERLIENPELLEGLDPAGLRIEETHISVVLITPERVLKFKKARRFPFLDYSTLARRKHFCEREVVLNQRLSQGVYRGVRSVVVRGEKFVLLEPGEVEGEEVVEWAVEMAYLPDAWRFDHLLEAQRLEPGSFRGVARRLARFYEEQRQEAEEPEAIMRRLEGEMRANLLDSAEQIGVVVEESVYERLTVLTEDWIEKMHDWGVRRLKEGHYADGHGDLRLEHLYLTEEERLEILDCVEFDDSLRVGDPLSDLAFLWQDLAMRGYEEEARALMRGYFSEAESRELWEGLRFFGAYRSCVRGKVRGFKVLNEELSAREREEARRRAACHWLFSLATLEEEDRRPRLILISGLPASGKSTVGRELLAKGKVAAFLDSDVVRKELAGISPREDAVSAVGEGIYTPEFSDRTYGELERRAARALVSGKAVAVAATFVKDRRRRDMVSMARALGLDTEIWVLEIDAEETRARLKARKSDASDATFDVYQALKQAWEPISDEVRKGAKVIRLEGNATGWTGRERS